MGANLLEAAERSRNVRLLVRVDEASARFYAARKAKRAICVTREDACGERIFGAICALNELIDVTASEIICVFESQSLQNSDAHFSLNFETTIIGPNDSSSAAKFVSSTSTSTVG